jgi:hypothetical protein
MFPRRTKRGVRTKPMGKRIFLFLLTNLAIVLTLTIVVSVLGVAGGP